MEDPQLLPQILSPSTCGTRKSNDSNSPEFEFWMIRNPSFPQPNLLSADELFSDGFLLPLHLLNLSNHNLPPHPHDPQPSGSDRVQEHEDSTVESAELSPGTPSLTSSKRWMDIFKRSDKKTSRSSNNINGTDESCKEKDSNNNCKEKKREKKNGVGASNGVSTAELNINIWPFSRSRSAGNGGTRPRSGAAATRKVSSAPCSRSNSAGESKSRKWPSSPSRAGVHLGRSSPVWQVRRGGAGVGGGSSRSSDTFILKNAQKGIRKDGNEGRRKTPPSASAVSSKARVLSLNVPTCIGYRHHLSCRSDENSGSGVAAGGVGNGDVSGEGIRGSNLFNIRSLFTKKVY